MQKIYYATISIISNNFLHSITQIKPKKAPNKGGSAAPSRDVLFGFHINIFVLCSLIIKKENINLFL